MADDEFPYNFPGFFSDEFIKKVVLCVLKLLGPSKRQCRDQINLACVTIIIPHEGFASSEDVFFRVPQRRGDLTLKLKRKLVGSPAGLVVHFRPDS